MSLGAVRVIDMAWAGRLIGKIKFHTNHFIQGTKNAKKQKNRSKPKKKGKKEKLNKEGAPMRDTDDDWESKLKKQSSEMFPFSPKPVFSTRSPFTKLSALPPLPGMKKGALPSLK